LKSRGRKRRCESAFERHRERAGAIVPGSCPMHLTGVIESDEGTKLLVCRHRPASKFSIRLRFRKAASLKIPQNGHTMIFGRSGRSPNRRPLITTPRRPVRHGCALTEFTGASDRGAAVLTMKPLG
jgi:hypothetical protein